MHNRITVTGANKVFLTVLVIFLTFSILIGIIGVISGADIANEYFYTTILVTQLGMILSPVLFYAFRNKLDFREVFRLNKLGFLPAVLIIVISVPAIYVAGMFNTITIFILQFIGDIPPQPIPVPQNIPELLIGILVIGVAPAVCEEALHRGVLLKAYERRGSIKAVVISAVMFGFFHFDITNLLGPIFLGILIGYYVMRTNSIFAGVLAHFANNAIAEILSYATRNQAEPQKVAISVGELGQHILFGAAGIIIIFILIKIFKKVTEKSARLTPPISSVRKDIASIISHWPIIICIILYILTTGLFVLSIFINRIAG